MSGGTYQQWSYAGAGKPGLGGGPWVDSPSSRGQLLKERPKH